MRQVKLEWGEGDDIYIKMSFRDTLVELRSQPGARAGVRGFAWKQISQISNFRRWSIYA